MNNEVDFGSRDLLRAIKTNFMNLTDDLLQYARDNGSDTTLQDVRIGLHWTAVVSQRVGLAATLPDDTCCVADELRNGGHLHEMTAFALAEYLRSPRPLEASVGMAALNSFLPVNSTASVELNARDLMLARGREKNVALVGHFAFTEELRRAAGQLWVLELEPMPGDVPTEQAPELLPQADVIGVTATTLLNHTFDDLTRLFPPQALVVMLGPSTPLCPVLFDYGVDVLAGSIVTDANHLLHLVSQSSPLHRPTGLQRLTLVRDRTFISGRRL